MTPLMKLRLETLDVSSTIATPLLVECRVRSKQTPGERHSTETEPATIGEDTASLTRVQARLRLNRHARPYNSSYGRPKSQLREVSDRPHRRVARCGVPLQNAVRGPARLQRRQGRR